MALDNQLEILEDNIALQEDALKMIKIQKSAARATELAVRKFEAEVFKNQSRQYSIQQAIFETVNRINYLVGRYPQPIHRNSQVFSSLVPDMIYAGIPSQLLENRPDIRQAELGLAAAKLDIKVAKAEFYPSLGITAGVGFRAFNPKYLVRMPESVLYSLAGDLASPLINRNAIKAQYYTANAKQIQAAFTYERTLLQAYIEVANQISNISNLKRRYDLEASQVQALSESITISNALFKSARADYMEVLLTQRDALESRFELIETKKQQMNALVNIYQALGGGWNPGLLHEFNRNWGATVGGDTIIRRSAIGLSKDKKHLFYALGDAVTAQSIGRAMITVGAHDAAQLDVNHSYPRFLLFEKADGGAVATAPIIPDIKFNPSEYVRTPSQRDFFFLTRKQLKTAGPDNPAKTGG
jgi:outer membrane protein TolC